jgi:hypothetical protein
MRANLQGTRSRNTLNGYVLIFHVLSSHVLNIFSLQLCIIVKSGMANIILPYSHMEDVHMNWFHVLLKE